MPFISDTDLRERVSCTIDLTELHSSLLMDQPPSEIQKAWLRAGLSVSVILRKALPWAEITNQISYQSMVNTN
jgi:hypothetical protein